MGHETGQFVSFPRVGPGNATNVVEGISHEGQTARLEGNWFKKQSTIGFSSLQDLFARPGTTY